MTLRDEWQLVAHKPKSLTLSQLAIAHAIARRLPNADSVRIPQRTLLAESGVKSSGTVVLGLTALEEAGLISITPAAIGSRKASLITWLLACPEDCRIDHQNANKKLPQKTAVQSESQDSSRSDSRSVTRPDSRSALRIDIKKERRDFFSFIEEELSAIETQTQDHQDLAKALSDPEQHSQVRERAELLSAKATIAPEAYLKRIVRDDPKQLLPRAKTAQALAQTAKTTREKEASRLFLAEQKELEKVSAPPPKCEHGQTIALCSPCIRAMALTASETW
jgi:hypothetical protein